MSLRAPVLVLVSLLAMGCGPSSGSPGAELDAGALDAAQADASASEPTPGTSPEAGSGAGAGAGSGAQAGSGAPDTSSPRPQTNVDFESAQRIEPGDVPRLQDERSVDQIDYYVFSGEAGEFYEITTDRGSFMPDNVILLYDADRRVIARNDEAGLGAGEAVDARLIVRLPESGDYYVTVEDIWTPETFFGSTLPLLFYHLAVRELTEDTPGVSIARGEGAVSVAFVDDVETGYAHALLLCEPGAGELIFDFAGRTDQALIGTVLATGPAGNGSTIEGGALRVVDDDDAVLAYIDRANGQAEFHPPVSDADYHLRIGVVDAPGDNAFHAIDLTLLPDNPKEQDEDTNGEQSAAEPIELQGLTWRRGLILLELPPSDDDYFAIEANGGDHVTVTCAGESSGSGVRGMQAELLDGADAVLGSAAEVSYANLSLEAEVADTGPIYLHLWAAAGAPDAEALAWARCAVDLGP